MLEKEDGDQFPILRYAESISDALQHAYPGYFESVLVREATDFEIRHKGDSFKM
jgi:hypothetical protein